MKKHFRAIIVDDERLARKDLISLLSEHDNIQVVGEADDVPSAISAIEQLDPDVVFLDIQMPGASGFDLLDRVNVQARIIFVTAFDEYAIRAFEVNALDYLLKPVNPVRLAKTIERMEQENETIHSTRKLEYNDRLFLTFNSQLRFLKVNSIIAINSAGDYSQVLLAGGQNGLVLKSMKEWDDRLPPQYFCRIHRSTIINMEYVDRLEDWFNYAQRVYLKGIEKPFIMSRRFVAKLKEKLG